MMNKKEREELNKIYDQFEEEGQKELEKRLTSPVFMPPKIKKKIRDGLKRYAEEAKKEKEAKEAKKELRKTVDSIPKRSPLRADLDARLANIETKKRLLSGETKTGLSEDDLAPSKGLKKFFFGENYVWAINQKNANKKAKKLNYL